MELRAENVSRNVSSTDGEISWKVGTLGDLKVTEELEGILREPGEDPIRLL